MDIFGGYLSYNANNNS